MTSSILAEYLDPRAVCPRITAASADEVIGRLAAKLEEIGCVKPTYRAAVISREASLPTGLPLGDDLAIAVPHTDPEHVLRAGMAIATVTEPIGFKSMEDPDQELPVKIVIALALLDKDAQIEMLQTIAEVFQNSTTMRRIADAVSTDEILAALDIDPTPLGE